MAQSIISKPILSLKTSRNFSFRSPAANCYSKISAKKLTPLLLLLTPSINIPRWHPQSALLSSLQFRAQPLNRLLPTQPYRISNLQQHAMPTHPHLAPAVQQTKKKTADIEETGTLHNICTPTQRCQHTRPTSGDTGRTTLSKTQDACHMQEHMSTPDAPLDRKVMLCSNTCQNLKVVWLWLDGGRFSLLLKLVNRTDFRVSTVNNTTASQT